jgi:hypothetical protein
LGGNSEIGRDKFAVIREAAFKSTSLAWNKIC